MYSAHILCNRCCFKPCLFYFAYSKFCTKLKYFWQVNVIYIKHVIVVIIFLLPPYTFVFFITEMSRQTATAYWNLKVRAIPEGACPDGHNRLQQ